MTWVVEAVHGEIDRKFKLLHYELYNILKNVVSYFKICCFLVNTFGKRFISNVPMINEVIGQITKKVDKNTLAEQAEAERWNDCSWKYLIKPI